MTTHQYFLVVRGRIINLVQSEPINFTDVNFTKQFISKLQNVDNPIALYDKPQNKLSMS